MGWVVESVSDRLKQERGSYAADDWEQFAEDNGLRCVIRDLPDWLPAFIVRDIIVINRNLSARERAHWAWHELAHAVLHPGNQMFWDRLPWGYLVLSKQERQANEFAQMFPVWGET